jgi:hypothetical protein
MPPILNPGETLSAEEFDKILNPLMVDGRGKWNRPLAADELLEMHREAFEPLFHGPPLGPIPDYLKPHTSVHGCVAEYEEKLDYLERWKAQKLDWWLKARVGKKFTVGEKVFEISRETGDFSTPDKYWLKLA